MPIVTIALTTHRDVPDLERRAAEIASRHAVESLRKRADLTSVLVTRAEPTAWFVGGPSLAEQGKASVWLEIKVVDGTNTKEEKEGFVAAIFAGFSDLLGELHPESYVHVHEVSADAYGFGGLTQERRYVAGRLGVDPTPR